MAYYGSGSGGSAFGGFVGGYDHVPGLGVVSPTGLGSVNPGLPATLGANLPSVDPNNYLGTVHFGPSTLNMDPQVLPFQPGAGIFDPSLNAGGAAGFGTGY